MDLPFGTDELIRRTLAEDLGRDGDITSRATVPDDAMADGRCVARAPGVVSGLAVFTRVFEIFDDRIQVRLAAADGDAVETGALLAEVEGPARSLLTAERTALNLLQLLSGVATLTRAYVDACAGTQAKVLCTRKTVAGLRALQRRAVADGGGALHRAGLDDGILIKRNHLRIAGGVEEAVRRAKAAAPHTLKVEVEVESLDELREALDAGADAILLDNAGVETVREAVAIVDGRVPLEVSGGVNLDTIGEIAAAGEVLISVGRLTHSAPAMDIALEVRPR